MQAAKILYGEQRTGQRHERDAAPKARADALAEDRQRDQRGRHDLKVVEQRRVCRRGGAQTHQQENGGGNIQKDHRKRIGKLRARKVGLRRHVAAHAAHKRDRKHPRTRTQIQKSRHQRGGHMVKQQLGKRRVDRVQRRRQHGKKNAAPERFRHQKSSLFQKCLHYITPHERCQASLPWRFAQAREENLIFCAKTVEIFCIIRYNI